MYATFHLNSIKLILVNLLFIIFFFIFISDQWNSIFRIGLPRRAPTRKQQSETNSRPAFRPTELSETTDILQQ